VLIALHQALYVVHRKEIMDPALEAFYAYRDLPTALRDDVDALLSNPNTVALLVEADGEVLGYITGHVEEDRRRVLPRKGVVEDWYVEPAARGRDVGRLLFDALVEVFRDRGCQVVESATWPFNKGARAAHTALGFREVEVKYRLRIDGGEPAPS